MKIICIGRNYAEHAREMKGDVPTEPVYFMKPDTSLLKEADFYYPGFTKDLHHEIELVLKISKAGKLRLNVSAEKDKLCVVEQSDDLLHWSELTRYTNSAETVEITALSPTNAATVFRVRTD